MPCPNQGLFESDEFLVQICDNHIFYAERNEVCFDFKNMTRFKVYRTKDGRKVSRITYRMKGQLDSFQIDGFKEAEMEEMARLLKARAREFSIAFAETGDAGHSSAGGT
jgi:hypothetical protein